MCKANAKLLNSGFSKRRKKRKKMKGVTVDLNVLSLNAAHQSVLAKPLSSSMSHRNPKDWFCLCFSCPFFKDLIL